MLIKNASKREGHTVNTGESVVEITEEKLKYTDLILLDVMMPKEDGFSYLSSVRN